MTQDLLPTHDCNDPVNDYAKTACPFDFGFEKANGPPMTHDPVNDNAKL
jgi:hypothetical protein